MKHEDVLAFSRSDSKVDLRGAPVLPHATSPVTCLMVQL